MPFLSFSDNSFQDSHIRFSTKLLTRTKDAQFLLGVQFLLKPLEHLKQFIMTRCVPMVMCNVDFNGDGNNHLQKWYLG